jgi:diguanylate cyclase (GGDEF)-like protein
LVEIAVGPTEDELVLESDDEFFSARLPKSSKGRAALEPGSLLELTGVCATRIDETQDAHHFEILLRTPADVVVLEKPSWWNAKHAGWVVSGCLLTALMALAIYVFLRRQHHLQELAVTDALTGLYNRRGFLHLATRDWRIAVRRRATMLLFYIDLDRFKQINDSFGHKVGDQALRAVADLLRECFRTTDIVSRLGGDEFAIACDAAADSPAAIEERIENAVRKFNQIEDHVFGLSLSVGVLVCDASKAGESIDELMAEADALMYARKQERRGREA